MTDMEERDPVELEKEGVPGPLSTTYVVPGGEQGFPPARRPGLRLRVVPNETLLPGPLGDHLGELVQQLVDEGAELGILIELDTSDRTRPGEFRVGASPVEVIALFAAGLAAREAGRLIDRLFDAALAWVLDHRRRNVVEPVIVVLYGPDGEVLREVEVPQDGRDPVSKR
jgi:hypothetical protein